MIAERRFLRPICQTCHQANGLGVAGQYPPLAGSEFTTGGSRRPAMIVLKGLTGPVTVKGQKFGAAVMQPWDKTLTDQKIAGRSHIRAK
jgi:mono/diheme cytochrome c family protein